MKSLVVFGPNRTMTRCQPFLMPISPRISRAIATASSSTIPGTILAEIAAMRLVDALADVEQLLDRVVRPGCLVVNLGSHWKPLVARADRDLPALGRG